MKNDKKDSGFIQEVVKDKTRKKSFLLRLVSWIVIAAAGAFAAAFVFAFTLPVAKELAGTDKKEESKIKIPEDEKEAIPEPTVIPTSTPKPAEPTEEPEETAVESEKPTGEPVVIVQDVGIDDYEKIYSYMKEIARPVQRAIVKVTGITSQTDYFNQTYENSQQTTGLIFGENESSLFIVTDYSVLENVERIQIEFNDGQLIDGVFLGSDNETGLAVIKVALNDIPMESLDRIEVAELGNSYMAAKGDPIIALGNPMGYSDYMCYGMITSVSNSVSVYDDQYTVFTTSISGSVGGNGVIIDLNGRVIGIIMSGTLDFSTNTVNAYSVSQIKSVLEKLSNGEARAEIGIKATAVSSQISERTGIPKGIIVTEVKADSPAMIAGLTVNDVIIRLDEQEIQTVYEYAQKLKELAPRDIVKLVAMRKGTEAYSEVEYDIVIGEK